MSDGSLVFFCTFSAVVLLGYFVSLLQAKPETKQLRNRLSGDARQMRQKPPAGIMPLLRRLGLAAAEPFMPKTRERQSGLRHSLARAGI
jgi:tight adherence protein C